MKKILVTFTILISSLVVAQRGTQEVSIDLADALAMKTLELNYEYYLGEQSSVGLSALFNFEKRSSDFKYNEKNMFTPYFRHYFTSSKNWNYFGEIFMGFNSGEDDYKEGAITKYRNYTDGALGVSVGTKYTSNGGLMVSLLGGIGRNLFSENSPILVPRLGVNIGYRF